VPHAGQGVEGNTAQPSNFLDPNLDRIATNLDRISTESHPNLIRIESEQDPRPIRSGFEKDPSRIRSRLQKALRKMAKTEASNLQRTWKVQKHFAFLLLVVVVTDQG
jgi:hypothetical protein